MSYGDSVITRLEEQLPQADSRFKILESDYHEDWDAFRLVVCFQPNAPEDLYDLTGENMDDIVQRVAEAMFQDLIYGGPIRIISERALRSGWKLCWAYTIIAFYDGEPPAYQTFMHALGTYRPRRRDKGD